MKYIFSCLFIVLLSTVLPMNILGQVPLSLEDLIPGGVSYSKFCPVMPQQLAWLGNDLAYIKGDSILCASKEKRKNESVLITLSEINHILDLHDNKQIKKFIYPLSMLGQENDLFLKNEQGDAYIFNLQKRKLEAQYSIHSQMKNFEYIANRKILVYTRKNNLFIQYNGGREFAITNEQNQNIIYGQAVHRNEFGINKGIFVSPTGSDIAFYRMDQTMVTDYPLVDTSCRIAKLHTIKYPMAGMKSHHVTLGVYNIDTQKTIYLKTGYPKEKYLTNVAWNPQGSQIYVAELNRGQDTCNLKSYDAIKGNLKSCLFSETSNKYVEPLNPIQFLPNNPNEFIWQSRRDGFNHLYLYTTQGKLLKQLTKGKWEILSVMGIDKKGKAIYFASNEASPIECHLYKLNFANNKKIELSKEPGVHQGALNHDGSYIFDSYTDQHNPGKVALTSTTRNKTTIVYKAKNPFENTKLPEISLGTIKAGDGITDLYYRLVKPLNFDIAKKYPTIVYVYGGPHSQLVDDSWMGQVRGWDIYMAEKGYVVFTLDNRGTSNRGMDFEAITHRQLGITETEDQMCGVRFLKSLPYVDSTRMGVHGWSFGGFMTLNLILRHPEVFKVAVAGGPVTDWHLYEIMYGERYMDTPQENPDGYQKTSMLNLARNLRGRLLIIHGDQDNTVVMQNSLRFLKACIRADTQPDFFIYPGQMHNMIGRDRVHLHQKITRYFDDFLK